MQEWTQVEPPGIREALVCQVRSVYRPRNPTRSPLYRLFDRHFERFVVEYEGRYEHRFGPLRKVIRPTVEEYLDCGRLHNGFARIRCPRCRGEHLLAFSCQTRNFCPSCIGPSLSHRRVPIITCN